MAQLLNFTDNDLLGSVTHVDTEQIVVEIENTVIMGQICVGNLVAIETGKRHEFLISLIDKVMFHLLFQHVLFLLGHLDLFEFLLNCYFHMHLLMYLL